MLMCVYVLACDIFSWTGISRSRCTTSWESCVCTSPFLSVISSATWASTQRSWSSLYLWTSSPPHYRCVCVCVCINTLNVILFLTRALSPFVNIHSKRRERACCAVKPIIFTQTHVMEERIPHKDSMYIQCRCDECVRHDAFRQLVNHISAN